MIDLLRRYLPPYRTQVIVVMVLLLGQAVGNLALPTLNADIINDGVLTADLGKIWTLGGVMLAISVVLGIAAILTTYLAARIGMGVGRDLRRDGFAAVQTFSLKEMNSLGAPSLITRTTNDVLQVQLLIMMGLNLMVLAPISVIGGVIMALYESARLSLVLVVILPLMVVVMAVTLTRAIPIFRSVQTKIDMINRVLRENLTGIRVIRAFVRTKHEEKRFAAANDDLTDTQLSVARLLAITMPALFFIINLSSVGVVGFGGKLISDGDLEIGTLTAFISYMMQILFSVLMAVVAITMIPRAAASADRILEVLDVEPVVADPAPAKVKSLPPLRVTSEEQSEQQIEDGAPGRPLVEFLDVDFRYPGAEQPVLCDITLDIVTGGTTAIVGSTGSGKSTLLNLIPRLFDPTQGEVRYDGVDLRDLPREELWSRMGLVPQRAFLFSGTIADNLRFAKPDATETEMWQALDVAQASEFVSALSDGLQARVEQGGANFSGGQRQRLAIARALVRRPPLLLFDDSFSALDYATDARLRAALASKVRHAAKVVVAQRVSTIRHADLIVVLDGGRIVGTGRHEDLLASCETYRQIVDSQYTPEAA